MASATLHGERVTLRPLAAGDRDVLRRLLMTPEVARWWGVPEPDFPEADDPDAVRWAIVEGGAVIGMIQACEEDDPDFRHASIDLYLDPARHGRGLGPEAIELLVAHLVGDRGHHRITIDPAADNVAAIETYRKVGFAPVGTLRRAWRDPSGVWRDQLLMERVEPE